MQPPNDHVDRAFERFNGVGDDITYLCMGAAEETKTGFKMMNVVDMSRNAWKCKNVRGENDEALALDVDSNISFVHDMLYRVFHGKCSFVGLSRCGEASNLHLPEPTCHPPSPLQQCRVRFPPFRRSSQPTSQPQTVPPPT